MFLNEKRKKLKIYEKRNWQIHYQNMEWSDLFLSIIINKHPLQLFFFDFFFVEFTQITWPKNITLQSEKILRREEKSQTLERKNRTEILKGDRPQITSPLQPATSLSRSLSEIYRQIHRYHHHS